MSTYKYINISDIYRPATDHTNILLLVDFYTIHFQYRKHGQHLKGTELQWGQGNFGKFDMLCDKSNKLLVYFCDMN